MVEIYHPFIFYTAFNEVEEQLNSNERNIMFRNINDIIHYVRGDWAKENNLMDDYLNRSNKKLQVLVDDYDDGTNIGERISDYGNDVYILGMLAGARFGRNEVLKIVSDIESKQ